MTTELETLRAMVTDLRIERDALSTDYELLSDHYKDLLTDNEALKTRNSQLIAEREVFRTAIRELRTENEELINEVCDTNQQVTFN